MSMAFLALSRANSHRCCASCASESAVYPPAKSETVATASSASFCAAAASVPTTSRARIAKRSPASRASLRAAASSPPSTLKAPAIFCRRTSCFGSRRASYFSSATWRCSLFTSTPSSFLTSCSVALNVLTPSTTLGLPAFFPENWISQLGPLPQWLRQEPTTTSMPLPTHISSMSRSRLAEPFSEQSLLWQTYTLHAIAGGPARRCAHIWRRQDSPPFRV
mmetsp:Transcript_4282/g.11458  ORF Transcript_4282/g.11458 Transcript_4282/m.11458 type:complete len:221 (-) Transcript_4282:16-678(-)